MFAGPNCSATSSFQIGPQARPVSGFWSFSLPSSGRHSYTMATRSR